LGVLVADGDVKRSLARLWEAEFRGIGRSNVQNDNVGRFARGVGLVEDVNLVAILRKQGSEAVGSTLVLYQEDEQAMCRARRHQNYLR
jgi:hypothetical protein